MADNVVSSLSFLFYYSFFLVYSNTTLKSLTILSEHCGNLNCPPYSKCMLSSSGEPYCACRDVSECPREYKRLCGKDKKAYKNLCVLKAEACTFNETVEITDASYCGKNFVGT